MNFTQGNKSSADFYENSLLYFYLPYHIDDKNRSFTTSDDLTIVPEVLMDSDDGVGFDKKGDPVLVNDDYAERNYTILVGHMSRSTDCTNASLPPVLAALDVDFLQSSDEFGQLGCSIGGGSQGGGNTNTPNQYTGDCSKLESRTSGGYVRQVFIGHFKKNSRKQYDALISFTGNGGGSEFRIGMLDSRDQIAIDSIGNITASAWDNVVSVDFSRRDIRKKKRKWVGSIWHPNWECSGEVHEAMLGIYEEDTEGNVTFDGKIDFTVADIDFDLDVNVDIKNRSKDELIRKIVREKTEFFATNLLDQGGGSWNGEFSFADRSWAIYDKGADVSYTMPHRWVYVGNNTY